MPRPQRSFTSIRFGVGAKDHTRVLGQPTEPTIFTTLRRVAAAVVLLPTLLIASPVAAKPAPDSFTVATLVDHTARVQAVAADRASRLHAAVTTDLTAVAVVPLSSSGGSSTKPVPYTQKNTGSRIDTVIRFALAQRGKPYRWGASGPGAYDCSGLIMRSFAQIGVRLPHQSEQMVRDKTRIARANWTPGTVLKYPGHVALYLGSGKMIHASRAGKPVAVVNVYGSPTGYRII